jgi:hypothetical protein
MKLRFMVMAFAMTLAAGPVRAQDWFESCDGYTSPGSRWDGMTGQGGVLDGLAGRANLWSADRDSRRPSVNYSHAGIESCNESLGDSRLLPAFALRRAHLLQARALHRFAGNDRAVALADLDAADSAIGGDAFGRRSLGVADALLRAYLLLISGDRAAAAERAEAARASRPWDPDVGVAAVRIQFAPSGDWDAYRAHLRDLSRIEPSAIATLFALAVTRGAFDEAVLLYPQIRFEVPREHGGYVIQNLLERRLQTVARQLQVQGAYAYALAATGEHARALTTIAEARSDLAALSLPPQGQMTNAEERDRAAFAEMAPMVAATLDRFERLIRMRIQVAEGNVQPVLAEFLSHPPEPDGATLDLVRAMSASSESMRRQLAPAIAEGERRIAADIDGARLLPLGELVRLLPDPESEEQTPAFARGSNGLLGEREGFGTRPSRIEGAQTLTYTSRRGSLATANEFALLRAAQLAREGGHRGFVVLSRQGFRRALDRTIRGVAIARQANGQVVEIDVVFVDPAQLPPAYAAAPWRVADAEAVWNGLSPVYVRQAVAATH